MIPPAKTRFTRRNIKEVHMRKEEARGCVEVKAAVTEVLDSKTDYIYDGGARRECERQAWRGRRST